tara:strand:- start:227760 stop:228341 length:582 start_codon:yes stop_codon:yes gene_type:complete
MEHDANYSRGKPVKAYKAIIFDRDGTLNATSKSEGGYVLSKDEMILLPYVQESLARLKARGVRLYVFTQQRCIGKKMLTEDGLVEIHQRLNTLLGKTAQIDAYYHCPHLIEDGCDCSKPKPGMLFKCLNDYQLNPEDVLVVGDSLRDYESAKAAGLDFSFVPNDTGKHTHEEYIATGQPFYKNLQELVFDMYR